jgi:hypothetical protein
MAGDTTTGLRVASLCDTAAGMEPRFILPPELAAGASISGNEYAWPTDLFPDVACRAEALGFACLGGQFQFRAPAGICEMYWHSADSTDRQPGEAWHAYCERSRIEVLGRFKQIMAGTDFLREARQWQQLEALMEQGFDVLSTLVFCADFIVEPERSAR